MSKVADTGAELATDAWISSGCFSRDLGSEGRLRHKEPGAAPSRAKMGRKEHHALLASNSPQGVGMNHSFLSHRGNTKDFNCRVKGHHVCLELGTWTTFSIDLKGNTIRHVLCRGISRWDV